jgi:ribosome-associated protein
VEKNSSFTQATSSQPIFFVAKNFCAGHKEKKALPVSRLDMIEPQNKIILPDSDEKLLALCDVETYRASGKGGQHVNKTDSAVRLIYRPYRIAVTCQKERSQYLNKLHCLEKLREKVARLNYRAPKRIATRMSTSKKEEGLNKKNKHGEKKKLRTKIVSED